MAVEPNYRRIGDLDKTLPNDDDPQTEGDDQLRGIKSSLLGNLFSSATELWLRLSDSSAALAKFLQNAVRIIPNSDIAEQTLEFRNAADSATVAQLRSATAELAVESLSDDRAVELRTQTAGVPSAGVRADAGLGGRLGRGGLFKVGVSASGAEVAGDGSNTLLDFFESTLGTTRRARINANHVSDRLEIQAEGGYEWVILKGAFEQIRSEGDTIEFRNGNNELAFKINEGFPAGARGNSLARVYDWNGNNFPVGFNVLPVSATSTNIQLGDEHCGFRIDCLQSLTATLPASVGVVGNYTASISTGTGVTVTLNANPGQNIYIYRGSTLGRTGPHSSVTIPAGNMAVLSRRTSTDDWDILPNSGATGS